MEKMAGRGNITFVENVKVSGRLHFEVFKRINGVKQLIEVFDDKNLIVNMARVQMAHLIAGEFDQRNITKIGFGEGQVPPELLDTTLDTGAYIKNVDGYTFPEMGHTRFNWSLDESEANGMAITEFGLFCLDGVLFARRIRQNEATLEVKPLNKESDISFQGYWEIQF